MGAAPTQSGRRPFQFLAAVGESAETCTTANILGIWEWVKRKAGEASDAGEILIEGEN